MWWFLLFGLIFVLVALRKSTWNIDPSPGFSNTLRFGAVLGVLAAELRSEVSWENHHWCRGEFKTNPFRAEDSISGDSPLEGVMVAFWRRKVHAVALTPADDDVPVEVSLLGEEGLHQQGEEVQSLDEEPEVVGEHTVMEEDHDGSALQLVGREEEEEGAESEVAAGRGQTAVQAGIRRYSTVWMKQCSLSSWAYSTPSLMKTEMALRMKDTNRFMWMKFLVQCSFLRTNTHHITSYFSIRKSQWLINLQPRRSWGDKSNISTDMDTRHECLRLSFILDWNKYTFFFTFSKCHMSISHINEQISYLLAFWTTKC